MKPIQFKFVKKIPLEEMDRQFYQLEEEINARRQMLLKKQKKIKEIHKENEFLKDVKGDYGKYNHYILKQKQDQIEAFQLLNKYIDDLKVSGELSDENIKDSKEEQDKILEEITQIKKNLESLIKD
jgi:hypothetical protein